MAQGMQLLHAMQVSLDSTEQKIIDSESNGADRMLLSDVDDEDNSIGAHDAGVGDANDSVAREVKIDSDEMSRNTVISVVQCANEIRVNSTVIASTRRQLEEVMLSASWSDDQDKELDTYSLGSLKSVMQNAMRDVETVVKSEMYGEIHDQDDCDSLPGSDVTTHTSEEDEDGEEAPSSAH